jgi:uncharacterized protein YkwD
MDLDDGVYPMRRSHVLLGCVAALVTAVAGGAFVALDGSSGNASTPTAYGGGSVANGSLPGGADSLQVVGQDAGPSPSGSPASSPTVKPTTTAKPGSGSTDAYPMASTASVNQMLVQINQLRAQNGLPAYTILAGLDASAHKHNLTMAAGCGLSHQCRDEAAFGNRISAQGVKWTSAGENIGDSGPNSNTTAAVVNAAEGLTTSMYNEKPPDDGHRRNLLSTSYHHIGIDVIRDSKGTVWLTQDFSS